jgi:hypothetical protein
MSRWVLLLAGLLLGGIAQAHTAGTQSYAQLQRDDAGGWLWSWRIRPADFRAHPEAGSAPALAEWLADHSQARSNGADCTLAPTHPVSLRDGWLHGQWHIHCDGDLSHIHLLWLDTLPGHLHMLQAVDELHVLRGGDAQSLALGSSREPASPSAANSAFWPQWQQGLQHIVFGWDHLAFLLGLLLWATSLRALLGLVTGFTIGHSLALLLTVLAGIQPPAVSIELIIAASIIFVALPQRGLQQRRLSSLVILGSSVLAAWLSAQSGLLWAAVALLALGHLWQSEHEHARALLSGLLLAALFGLLHGFGFAGAVLEATQQSDQIWPILLGFNLGVETGQLALVLPAWWVLQRWRHGAPLLPTAQALSCGLGAYWFCQRLLAL